MKRLVFIVSLISALPVFGQVNVEDQRLTREKSGLSGSLTLAVELERGNSELTQIDIAPQAVYRYGPSKWFALNSYSFVETGELSVINEGFSHVRYNYEMTPLVVLEAFTQFQYNREQDLRERVLLGGGVRLNLVKETRADLALGVAAMYEYEELETDTIIRTPRNSNYVAASWTNKNVTVSNTVYFQPAMDDLGDLRVLDNLNISVALAKWLAFTTELEYRYDSEPPIGIREYDLSLKNGLTVKF